jgi:hypothetical protein
MLNTRGVFSARMSGAVRVSVSVVAILAFAIPAAAARPRPPTATQIRQAVLRLEHSRDLWATVDICDTKRHPRALGIRGQMPSLGFGATHEMNIQVEYQPTPKIGFKPDPDPHAKQSVALGYSASKLLQGGSIFYQFPRHTGLLRATVAFVWRRGHRQIARIVRTTTGGHRNVDGAEPPNFSAAQCLIR